MGFLWVQRVSHKSAPMMVAPSVTQILSPRTTMSSRWTSPQMAIDVMKFEVGVTCVVTKGQNQGRIGVVTGREKHIGPFEIVHVKDTKGRAFATRLANIFTISNKDDDAQVSLPRAKGIRDNILDERKKRLGY